MAREGKIRQMGGVPERVTLVFDGSCGFCTRSVRWVRGLDRRRRVTAVPFQRPGVPAAHGLSVAQCEAAVWAVTADGARYRGAGAVNAALAAALGSTLPLRLYGLPGVGWVQERVYELVARHRHRLPGDRPYCEQHPAECG